MLNEMLTNVARFVMQNPELETLIVYAIGTGDGGLEVNAALSCGKATAHDFGHGLAAIKQKDRATFELIIGGLGCALYGDDILKAIAGAAKNETCH